MRAPVVLAASLAGLIGSALLMFAAYAADPAKPYLGMSKEAILACAGEPHAKFKSGADAETLTYRYSGAGPVPAPPGAKKKKSGGLAGFFPSGDKADKRAKREQGAEQSAPEAGASPNESADTSPAAAADDAAGPSETTTAAAKDKAAPSETAAKRGKKGKKGKKDEGWSCTATLVFEHGLLARVTFAHKDVRGPYDWQKEKKNQQKRERLRDAPVPTCTFSLPNCTRAQ